MNLPPELRATISCACGIVCLCAGPQARAADQGMKHAALRLILKDATKLAKPAAQPEKPATVDAQPDTPPIFTHPLTPAEPSVESSHDKKQAEGKEADGAVVMPKVEVFGKRLDTMTKELRENDWASRWETTLTQPTGLDEAMNRVHLPLFGGRTAQARAAEAAFRVRLLEFERQLIVAIDLADSPQEKKDLRAFLEEIRSMRRGYGYGETYRVGK